jgi:hypothetical protein
MDNKLISLNFSQGVKAANINYDFNIVKGWIDRERLRIGGWGICEGFEMSYDFNYNITIEDGIFINEYGEEVIVDKRIFNCGMPDYYDIEENLPVSNDGTIVLKYSPFSPDAAGLIKYSPPEHNNKSALNAITIKETSTDSPMTIYSVLDNKIKVDAQWAGRTATVKYIYCNDQIDAFLIDSNGNYYREEGILSTTASKTNIDLSSYYLIGFARWIIGETISVEFIIDDRTYRKVYVDKSNILYLNGKPYKEAQIIYFEEPENPQENDLWYDRENNALCIWKETDGIYGWTVINDFSDVPIRQVKMWQPNINFPADNQTFLFDDSETNLRYIPDINALTIIIDQQVVMNDQFEEVTQSNSSSKPYLSTGIGFKLKEPLDKPTYVQCVVNHVVRNGALQNVFQRAAIFINENYEKYSVSNIDQVFQTDLEYCIEASQLEIWLDGAKLNKDVDFVEMCSDGITIASSANKDEMTTYFKVIVPLQANQNITYRISKYVWSYDQLNMMMSDIENKADSGLSQCALLSNEISNLSTNTSNDIKNLQNQIDTINNVLKTLTQYRLKSDLITTNDLDSTVKDSLFKSVKSIVVSAAQIPITVADLRATDGIIINYYDNMANTSRVLIENTDYMLNFNSDKTADIILSALLISQNATLIINTISFGV